MHGLSLLLLVLPGATAADPQISLAARAVLVDTLAEWDFGRDSAGWKAENQCAVSAANGLLKVQSTGDDPYLNHRLDLPAGQLAFRLRYRSGTAGGGAIYWTTSTSPRGEHNARHFPLSHDGQWHDVVVRFVVMGSLIDLRLDPGSGPGPFEIDRIQLVREQPHPLSVPRVERTGAQVRFTVRNDGKTPVEFTLPGQAGTIQRDSSIVVERRVPARRPVERVAIELKPPGWPPVRRAVYVFNRQVETDWIVRAQKDWSLQVAGDGSAARVRRDGRVVAAVAPLVHCDGEPPAMQLVRQGPTTLTFEGQSTSLVISMDDAGFTVTIDSPRTCTGPVVRAFGSLEQGICAGVEYLGKGETSSSTLDIETQDHFRYAPDPLQMTMPLMAFVTDQVAVALTWRNMQLQPLFATPNFFDGDDGHYMALRGTHIAAKVRIGSGPLDEAILWAIQQQGLPPLPPPPRTVDQQWALCLRALDGPLRSDAGWGHCVEPNWPRHPFSDMAATIWRLTGRAPQLPELVQGGAHVPNDAIYFVTGRAQQWLQTRSRRVRAIRDRQLADGSFRYEGKYRRGHFEDTASGHCARPVVELLEYARFTGDRAALDAGLRGLDYMMRFRTPRGAQTWELSLHTPDLLASAYLVWAYVRGYELTGDRKYLLPARKWALSGVPFVYLWSRYPTMAYATPPVYGATNWRAPLWIGLPVQWVGGVYAYALTTLAPHDGALDWNQLARGILIAGEQMQYPDGPYAGLLPDAFALPDQQRLPARINPCALVSLRLVLDGQLDGLSVAANDRHRVAAPLPVSLRGQQACVDAQRGVSYQLLINGTRIVAVQSKGDDKIPLE